MMGAVVEGTHEEIKQGSVVNEMKVQYVLVASAVEDPEREVPAPINKERPEEQVETEEKQGYESKEDKGRKGTMRKGYNSR